MNRSQFTQHMKLNPHDAGNNAAIKQGGLSEENVNRLIIGIINHVRSLGGDARITLQEHRIRTHNGFKLKKGEPEAQFSNITGKFKNKSIAVSVGKDAEAEKQEKALANKKGYQYFNAFDMKSFRDFLATL